MKLAEETEIIFPEFLKPGDKVGLVAPASVLNYADLQPGLQTLKEWGLEVVEGQHLRSRHFQFAGSDQERLADMQSMLNDPDIKAIFAGRGGYGCSRIIDQLDFSGFHKHPKWIIGFSDLTVILTHLLTLGFGSLHSQMVKNYGGEENAAAIKSIHRALFGEPVAYTVGVHPFNVSGEAEGMVLGGNLCLFTHLIGSVSEIDTAGAILFLEDVGEYVYNLDRLMIQLKRAGKLSKLAGLVVGQFTDLRDNLNSPFGFDPYEIIREHTAEYGYPTAYNFPVGHVEENLAMYVGKKARLIVDTKQSVFTYLD